MKNVLVLGMSAVLLLFVLASVSCEAGNLQSRIIGKWVEIDEFIAFENGDKVDVGFGMRLIVGKDIIIEPGTIEFLKDGIVIFAKKGGTKDISMAGDYKFIDDNRLKIDFKTKIVVLEVSIDEEGALILKAPTEKVGDRYLPPEAYKAYKAKIVAQKKTQR